MKTGHCVRMMFVDFIMVYLKIHNRYLLNLWLYASSFVLLIISTEEEKLLEK